MHYAEGLVKTNPMLICFQINPNNNRAITLGNGEVGTSVQVPDALQTLSLTLKQTIAYGHKVALHDIGEGEAVIKYSNPIVHTAQPIHTGNWIHLNNCTSNDEE